MDTQTTTIEASVSGASAHGSATAEADPPRARRRLGRDGCRVGGDAGHRPGPGLPHGRQEPLTEREVREALGLSHRAASLALAEAESWGIVERVPEPRRVGRRGPAGDGLPRRQRPLAVVRAGHRRAQGPRGRPDRRRARAEGREAAAALAAHPDDRELAALREWLATFLVFVRLFDRAVGLVPQLEPRELERVAATARADPGRDRPAPLRSPRRARRRRRHRARRGALAAVADGRAPGDEADVRRRPDRRAVASGRDRAARPTGRTSRATASRRRSTASCPGRGRVERLERCARSTGSRRPAPTAARTPIPIWGAWLDGRWYVEGGPTRWQRNLRENPQLAIKVESGDEVVIVEGTARELIAPAEPLVERDPGRLREVQGRGRLRGRPRELGPGRPLGAPAGQGVRLVRFPTDMTRFRF